jgi:hypothetical protein
MPPVNGKRIVSRRWCFRSSHWFRWWIFSLLGRVTIVRDHKREQHDEQHEGRRIIRPSSPKLAWVGYSHLNANSNRILRSAGTISKRRRYARLRRAGIPATLRNRGTPEACVPTINFLSENCIVNLKCADSDPSCKAREFRVSCFLKSARKATPRFIKQSPKENHYVHKRER